MFFLVKGIVGHVIPRFDNHNYLSVDVGTPFGHVDLFGVRGPSDPLIVISHSRKKHDLVRHFTV